MSIVRDAMVLNLQIGQWVGQRLDKAASDKVTGDAGAESGAARVNKHIVPKDALAPVQTAANSIRTHYYARTLPWRDNGDRLLTREMFQQFMHEHAALKEGFEQTVHEFLSKTYVSVVARAEFRMGSLFNPNDYPAPRALRSRFYVNLDIDAVTEAKDFRVKLEKDHLDQVRQSMEAALSGRIHRAVSDLWERLHTTLTHYATKMGKADAIFRDTTVANLQEIVALIPALNVLNDPNLTALANDIETRLLGWEPKDLRSNASARAGVAKEAQDILDTMAGFMTAYSGAAT